MSYKRILVKLSGEALMGSEPHGFCQKTLQHIVQDISQVVHSGLEVALVIGGGNIFRGATGQRLGMKAPAADTMGMLATVMNGIVLRDMLFQENIEAGLFSSLYMPSVCSVYNVAHALSCLMHNKVCIFVAGTGHAHCTTDTAAVLRARDMECEAVFKATKVPGVFSADPSHAPDATHYPSLSYEDVLSRRLNVMDRTAFTLAEEGEIPLVIFSILEPGALIKAMQGKGSYSVIQARLS